MEQMIQVINDNLISVMNGIKTHREVTEKSLLEIKTEMDEKLSIASEYRQNVEDARNIISNLEVEISGLDADLRDLREKFDEKDFKEILTAGNKAISAKIIKKRALINEQSGRILELTKKAHTLKNELIRLRDQKMSVEETLEKDLTLENYYGSRIQSIIEFTQEHPNELKDYVEIPESELLGDSDDYESVDIKKIVDGSIFEEIDEISSHEPELDESMIKEVLVNSESSVEEEEEEQKTADLSVTQQLDDLIFQANDIIERSKQPEFSAVEKSDESIKKSKKSEMEEILEIPTEPEEMSHEELLTEEIETIDVSIPAEVGEKEIKEEHIITPELNDSASENQTLSETFDEDIDEAKMLDALNAFSLESIDDTTADEEDSDALELMMENEQELQTIENLATIYDEDLKDSEMEGLSEDDLLEIDANLRGTSRAEEERIALGKRLKACSLDIERFQEEDLVKIGKELNDENALAFTEIMKKHNLAIANVYENLDILLHVTPDNLEQIVTELEKTGADANSISCVFNTFDKIDLPALKKEINANSERELGEILGNILPENENNDFIKQLGLNEKEEEMLRKSATKEELKIMQMFPNIVVTNYNELKKYEVDNLNECFTRHPHRFTMNPNHFAEILDKYDPEDLTRCINKNVAVIDRL